MKCYNCGNETDVKDSRPRRKFGKATVTRRRHCLACDIRFTTYELPKQLVDEFQHWEKMIKAIKHIL